MNDEFNDIFPNEIVRMVLEHLPVRRIKGVARVCIIWNYLSKTFGIHHVYNRDITLHSSYASSSNLTLECNDNYIFMQCNGELIILDYNGNQIKTIQDNINFLFRPIMAPIYADNNFYYICNADSQQIKMYTINTEVLVKTFSVPQFSSYCQNLLLLSSHKFVILKGKIMLIIDLRTGSAIHELDLIELIHESIDDYRFAIIGSDKENRIYLQNKNTDIMYVFDEDGCFDHQEKIMHNGFASQCRIDSHGNLMFIDVWTSSIRVNDGSILIECIDGIDDFVILKNNDIVCNIQGRLTKYKQ